MLPTVLLSSCFVTPPMGRLSAETAYRAASAPLMYAMAEDKLKYGHDPRDGLSAEAYQACVEWSAAPGTVSRLTTINQLQAALEAADAKKQIVVCKFVQDNCKACASTTDLYAETAKEYSSAGLFYEVSFNDARDLIKTCQLRGVPAAHVYARGKLHKAMALNAKKYDEFAGDLAALREDLTS